MAASDIVGMVGSVGSVVPYVGPIISAVGSIASGVLKNKEAQDQADRAAALRKKSDALQKGTLRPEYTKTLRAQEMAALGGLPGYNQYQSDIEKGIANNARAIQESSPNGAATLAAISATLGKANEARNQLYTQNAAFKDKKAEQVNQTLWNTGDKEMDLVGLQRADKAALNQGAMNLENASTANKVASIDQILASVSAGVQGLTKIGGSGVSGKTDEVKLNEDGSPLDPNALAATATTPSFKTGNETTGLSTEDVTSLTTKMNQLLMDGSDPVMLAQIRKILQQYSNQ